MLREACCITATRYECDLTWWKLQASEARELQRKLAEMQQQLHQADVNRTAAEAAVIELVPLHLTVSQLRQRLAAEMSALARLQVVLLLQCGLACCSTDDRT